jgi:hypothetical protein
VSIQVRFHAELRDPLPGNRADFPRKHRHFGVIGVLNGPPTHHRHVSEWVQDWFASDTSAREPLINPMGPIGGAVRTIRGGDWSTAARWVRVSKRILAAPATANSTLGFRCALPGR